MSKQKKLSERIREHALGPLGGETFDCVIDDDVFFALCDHKCELREHSDHLTPDERRMFALFVALDVESDE